jgi:hypothetical protein
MKRALILAAAAASVSTLFAVQSQAAVFYDVNFSNQVAGNTLSFQASTAGVTNTKPSGTGTQNASPNIERVMHFGHDPAILEGWQGSRTPVTSRMMNGRSWSRISR